MASVTRSPPSSPIPNRLSVTEFSVVGVRLLLIISPSPSTAVNGGRASIGCPVALHPIWVVSPPLARFLGSPPPSSSLRLLGLLLSFLVGNWSTLVVVVICCSLLALRVGEGGEGGGGLPKRHGQRCHHLVVGRMEVKVFIPRALKMLGKIRLRGLVEDPAEPQVNNRA
ncbi:uncharacterized protein [Spinacia oleracea]|uniref:Uncharacterized protein n=1 Tax=Spinacia oleracea TaxID=3562 RepID=A0ABM3RP30_SPIOL|nr:uncharacterized protein LOC130471343 [Spinacia oleracea]